MIDTPWSFHPIMLYSVVSQGGGWLERRGLPWAEVCPTMENPCYA
jgi:hypothetical protein